MDAATPAPAKINDAPIDSEARRARLTDIAQRAVDELVATYGEALATATITGSVARSSVDRHSDIDVSLLFDTLPDAEAFERENARAAESGGGFYGGDAEQGWALYRVVDGAKLDLAFGKRSDVEEMIAAVIERAEMEPTYQLIIDGLRRGKCLHGADRLRSLLAPTDAYPDALAEAMVRHHLRFRPIWVLRGMGADRGDTLLLAEEFLTLANSVFGVLCGLNRVYSPGKMKGIGTADGLKFAIAPARFAERIGAMFSAPLHAAVDDAEALVNELFALVEQHMPAIDVAPVRERFALCHAQSW